MCRLFEAVGGRNPALVAWRSQAALAFMRLGDRGEARRLATEELALARAWGAPRALGAALRAMGLVEGGGRGLEERACDAAGRPRPLAGDKQAGTAFTDTSDG